MTGLCYIIISNMLTLIKPISRTKFNTVKTGVFMSYVYDFYGCLNLFSVLSPKRDRIPD